MIKIFELARAGKRLDEEKISSDVLADVEKKKSQLDAEIKSRQSLLDERKSTEEKRIRDEILEEESRPERELAEDLYEQSEYAGKVLLSLLLMSSEWRRKHKALMTENEDLIPFLVGFLQTNHIIEMFPKPQRLRQDIENVQRLNKEQTKKDEESERLVQERAELVLNEESGLMVPKAAIEGKSSAVVMGSGTSEVIKVPAGADYKTCRPLRDVYPNVNEG